MRTHPNPVSRWTRHPAPTAGLASRSTSARSASGPRRAGPKRSSPSRQRPSRGALLPILTSILLLGGIALPGATTLPALADGGVSFQDVAAGAGSGISYQRTPSATLALAQEIRDRGTVPLAAFPGPYPIKSHGAPGVALLDFDRDGDLDLYVTNGPGTANSLFENRLLPDGELAFVDVAVAAGVGAADQDSTGVCFGDVDNDGDPDLYVLGRSEPNRLFENLLADGGGATFRDVTDASGTGGGSLGSTSCSFGDVDGDGLLDLVVANNFDMSNSLPIFVVPFDLNHRNQLFLNAGGNAFVDVSEESGVADAQDITWAIALVDIDQDGDLDVLEANDNGGIPQASLGGVDRGFLRWLDNDGSGHFTDRTVAAGLDHAGDWMGLAFADLDHDGLLDLFASNTGDYFEQFFGLPLPLGIQSSRWFLQRPDRTFADPGVGDLVATPFGWGTAAFDYDNDGDTDLIFYGGLDAGPFVESSNPGTLLRNDGDARFELDLAAVSDVDHSRRIEHGLAVGDLDLDGFPDVVSVSSLNLPGPPLPMGLSYGSPFDALAGFFPTFVPGSEPDTFVYTGVVYPLGTLAVERNSAGNGNGSISVETLGTVGLVSGGGVNRDGIGAVVSVTPRGSDTAIQPVVGGSSYASQNALATTFGLGQARTATVEVLWPGGVRNRLYGVRAGQQVLFPEIPCGFDDPGLTRPAYVACVTDSLRQLVDEGVLGARDRARFLSSALRAFAEARAR